MGKYLLLGASSDLCRTFMKRHEWQESDVIIAQYCHSRDKLEALQKTISAKMELWQADFSDETSTTAFGEKLKEAKLCLPISTTFLLKIYASRKLTGQIPKSKSMSSAAPCGWYCKSSSRAWPGQSFIRIFILTYRRTAKISRWICDGKICSHGHGKGIGLRIRTKRNTGQYDFPLYDGDEIFSQCLWRCGRADCGDQSVETQRPS